MEAVKERFRDVFLEAFPRSFLSSIGEEGFERRFEAAWEFIKKRKEVISVRKLKTKTFACIETLMDDQVFLVDTIEVTLKRLGIPYIVIIHPIIPIERDANGEITNIGEGKLESFIHVELPLDIEDAILERCALEVEKVLRFTQAMVADFLRMKKRVRDAINELDFSAEIGILPREEAEEYSLFLEWILEDNFVFIEDIQQHPCIRGRHSREHVDRHRLR